MRLLSLPFFPINFLTFTNRIFFCLLNILPASPVPNLLLASYFFVSPVLTSSFNYIGHIDSHFQTSCVTSQLVICSFDIFNGHVTSIDVYRFEEEYVLEIYPFQLFNFPQPDQLSLIKLITFFLKGFLMNCLVKLFFRNFKS